MKIVTLQDANAVNCCPCDWPTCAVPRKECQSISISPCGFSTPDYSTVTLPDADYCRLWKTRTETNIYQVHSTPGYTEYHETDTLSKVRQYQVIDGVCTEVLISSTRLRIINGVTIFDGPFTWGYEGEPGYTDYAEGTFSSETVIEEEAYTLTVTGTEVFSDEVTRSSLIAELLALIADLGEESWPGTSCSSESSANQLSPWLCEIVGEISTARYRFGVPASYSTVEIPRSTWEMTWDEMTASAAWWAWYDGGMIGAAPDASLALVTARDWTWAGDMESPWSDWYEIPIPESGMISRVVNVMVVCWKSIRLGHKPTHHGDQVALPE